MKRALIISIAICIGLFSACNNNDKSQKEKEASGIKSDTSVQNDTAPIVEINHKFNNVDPRLTGSLRIVVDHYLEIKNSLVNNSANEAALHGKEMAQAISGLDE